MILDLFETHIQTADLRRSAEFYEKVLGLIPSEYADPRAVRFFYIGAPGRAMLGIWETEPDKVRRRHFAFRVSPEEMKRAVAWLKARDLKVYNFDNDGTERPQVFGWMPAAAIYFDDPDGNQLELIAPLPDAPRPDLGVIPWEDWESMHGRGIETR